MPYCCAMAPKPANCFYAHGTVPEHAQKGAVLSPHSLLHVVKVCPSVLFVARVVESREGSQGLRDSILHMDLAEPFGVHIPLRLNVKPTV